MRGPHGHFMTLRCASDTTVSETYAINYGRFIGTAANITFSLCNPRGSADMDDREVEFVNASSGWQLILTSQDMVDQSDAIAIPPGGTVRLTCQSVSSVAPYRYAWSAEGQDLAPKWAAVTPTLAWTTATPTLSTTSYRAQIIDGMLHFDYDLATLDGGGATALTITLPFIPQTMSIVWPVTASVKIGSGNATNILGFIDTTSSTGETRQKVQFRNFQTLTDDAAARIRISGAIPLWGATSWTATLAWTGTPTVTSTTAVYKVADGVCYGGLHTIVSDGKGASTLTYTVPVPHNDVDQMVACSAIEAIDTGGTPSYSNPIPYLEAANATAANRLFSFGALTALTDTKACTVSLSFQYAVQGELAFTSSETFTTATPASYASSMRYSVSNRKCRFQYYGTSADGNGCTGATITLPIVPRYIANRRRALACNMIIDTTWHDAAAYIDHSQTTAAGRALVRLEYHGTATDAKTVTYEIAGEYEI